MPLEEYEMYRTKSVINPDSDTMTLGKYEPTIRPDGTPDWSTPGPNSYISKAGDTTYFSLGDDWNKITVEYGLDAEGKKMFKYFNKPALDDAVAQGKTIRFSHDPTLKMYEKSAIRWEWDYLMEQHGYKRLKPKGTTGMELNNMDILSDEICDVVERVFKDKIDGIVIYDMIDESIIILSN